MNLKKYEILLFICILHELSECMNEDNFGNTSKHEGKLSKRMGFLKAKSFEERKKLKKACQELLNIRNEGLNKGTVIEGKKKRTFHYQFNPGEDLTFDQLFPDEKDGQYLLEEQKKRTTLDQLKLGTDTPFETLFLDEKHGQHFLEGYDRKQANDQKSKNKE
ncbi:unnamed protein product [Meloidogyne enterolobii]|uniref:Uncharacterized protein n=1 Tax=Meloidogyne enterolobii TaxID=390850 RepID=A0ACB1ARZ0_MELEN